MAERREVTKEDALKARADFLAENYDFLPEQSGAAKESFDQAKDASEPLEQPAQPEVLEPRRVSSVQEMIEARRDFVREHFPVNEQDNDRETDREREDGSKMIQDEGLRHDMHPPSDIRDPVDREIFNDRLNDEFERSGR